MPLSQTRSVLYLKLAVPLLLLFIVVYGGANWLNSLREHHYHLYFQWELVVPFVPEMILVYLSLQLLFLLPLVHCDSQDMIVLAKRLALATVIAGIVFILIPAQSGFVRHESAGRFDALFSFLYFLDKPHNLLPSLHITLSTIVMIALLKNVDRLLRFVYIAWLLALYVSVLLVHQHHVLDIVTGIVLALVCVKLISSVNTRHN